MFTFKKGDPLETYCSDSTVITLYPKAQSPIVIGSKKRMSCKILAVFNISKQQNNLLKTYPLDSVKVYNYVTDNKYTYNDAIEICKSLDARLATYDEIEDAYKNGANWCSYGWSDDQMALFPIQKSVYNELKKIPGHERDCGRPGVNGGYFLNPNVRFGVNCYGVKPPITDAEKAMMDSKRNNFYPKTAEDALVDTKVEFWKKNKDKLMVVSGFNNNSWSRF
jgi:hypothetical protein